MRSMPLPEPSFPVSVSVGDAYQPLWMPGDRVALEVGFVLSTLIVRVTGPAVPAEFVAVHETVNDPSVVKVRSTQPVSVAPPPSSTCQARLTSPRYQPFRPSGAGGVTVGLMVGRQKKPGPARPGPVICGLFAPPPLG